MTLKYNLHIVVEQYDTKAQTDKEAWKDIAQFCIHCDLSERLLFVHLNDLIGEEEQLEVVNYLAERAREREEAEETNQYQLSRL